MPPRSLRAALVLGAITGAVFLGIGGRIAMRMIAVLDGTPGGFSPGGSMTVVFLGAAWGTVGGFLLWLGRRAFPRSRTARGLLFWVVVTLLVLRGLNPVSIERVLVFGPVVVAWGAVLYRVWCRRYVARWRQPAPAPHAVAS